MPLNLFKFTSSSSSSSSSITIHQHIWLRRAITTGKPKPPPAMSSGWSYISQPPHFIHNNNKYNNNYHYNKLAFRGLNSFRFCSGNMESRVVNDNKNEKRISENNRPPARQNSSAKLLTLPTVLTIARVAAVPILISTYYMDSRLGTTATTGIFIAAAITDWLDGYLARRMNLGTAFGAFLDPVADKLMVAATLVLLCTRPPEAALFAQFPWLLTVPAIAIIGREITMSAVREWAASQGSKLSEAVAVNNLGKWKTATQMTSLTILLLIRDSSFTEVGILGATGVSFLYVSAGLALWSLVVYMKKIWKVMLM
uniref:CDP-diacylglycerol--glycerol-3-phosphate 3-phosphatidyltransferase 2 n=1 Tax=Erigeron canadensis TaxID=72917 RepID=UPI001CB9314C|nr:CDP-diacylglycerol--glycerol-3-phosphate 3-phosphatidyltransferase 2 [Erigeron canadensis]